MVSPFLFFADERLSLAELSAACLDGVLVPLGEGFMPADAAETPWMRARSLAPLLAERWAAVRCSAAWIHGALAQEPSPHHLQRAGATRIRARSDARSVYHDVRLDPGDVCTMAGVHITTPPRTLVDLARSDDEGDLALARSWAAADPLTKRSAEAWLAQHPRFPHAKRAGAVLSATAALLADGRLGRGAATAPSVKSPVSTPAVPRAPRDAGPRPAARAGTAREPDRHARRTRETHHERLPRPQHPR